MSQSRVKGTFRVAVPIIGVDHGAFWSQMNVNVDFRFGKQKHTIITREYPQAWDKTKEKFYPMNDEKNNKLLQKYKNRIDDSKYILGGRLADYKYYDMHQVVGSALIRSEKELQ